MVQYLSSSSITRTKTQTQVRGDSKAENQKKTERERLSGQLWNDLDHLINIDKLHPSLQILCIIMPNKLGLFRPPKKRTRALIRFFNHRPTPLDAKLGFEHTEFPTL